MIGFGKLYPRASNTSCKSTTVVGKSEYPRLGLISIPSVSEVAYTLWENGYSDNSDENWYEAERRVAWLMDFLFANKN